MRQPGQQGGGAGVGGTRQRRDGRPGTGPAGGVRVALGLVAGALAIALCAVLVERFVLHAEWWQVRHTVTAEPVAPQSDVGPPPGPLGVSWEETTRIHRGSSAGYDGVAYDVARGQLVTASGGGLVVRDARNGAERWSYRRTGWTLLGWTSTRSRLVAYFERDGRRGDRLLVGFDELSGAQLWRRDGERPAAVSRATLRWPAGAGVALATDDGRRTLYGVSALTGKRLWRTPLPKGCRLYEGAAQPSDALDAAGVRDAGARGTGALAALAAGCRKQGGRLLAVDPGTGRVRWSRNLAVGESLAVRVLDGVVLAADASALRAFTLEGGRIAGWDGDGVCGDRMCPAVLAGGRLLVVRHRDGKGPGTDRMEAVDVRSGRVAWSRDVPGYVALAQAGGEVYALRPRLSEQLLPAGVDIVDPGSGGTTTAPAPFAMDPDLPGAHPWLAAAGGLLYAAVAEAAPRPAGAARLVALRGGPLGTGPAELGGVPVDDWPDACTLLKKPDLAAVHAGGRGTGAARTSVGPVALPRPVSCTYETKWDEPEDGETPGDRKPSPGPSTKAGAAGKRAENEPRAGGSPPSPDTGRSAGPDDAVPGSSVRGLTVSVRWVGETAGAAAAMLDALQAIQLQARERPDIHADQAYELGPTAGMIALRVDRVVLVVDVDRPPGAAARLARAVADRLRA
ncbi:outer membrane protein assembly factor BamB family protein [Actinomadura opuntiae]|uniref:outer membrane protein assembly factor BamB family protein n=1 Tax=Actinomadura sp. OS1-43 TaxID=604315 RepID=UPI00255B04F5|nr:PQQ-binding-like beta-propeller repeat protein [Actinomadura sp. OS1-43]MDL4814696.1 PQQ-binding-like beta-propeller repeat protein [Actinomadura sp. OS1-43]